MAPACRVCGQSLELIDTQEERWYCYKDDQLWHEKDQTWAGELTETQEEQMVRIQGQTVKYCKKCGNMLELEDKFCDGCGAEQKKVVLFQQHKTKNESEPLNESKLPTSETEPTLKREEK